MVPQPVPVPYVLDPMGYPIPMMPHNAPYGPNGMMPPISVPMLNLSQITSPRGMEYPAYIPPQFSVVDEPNLFIFHLPPDMDDEGLYNLFSDFGPIESVKVIVDKNSGESKGYGFVQFVNHTDAEKALAMNGRSIGCKRLSVSFKTPSPRNSPRSPGRGNSQPNQPHQYQSQCSPRMSSPRNFFVNRMNSPR